MGKTQSKKLIGGICCGALTAFGIVASAMSLMRGGRGMWVVCDLCSLVLLALIVYYAFIGYKKPHGNLLKYIILIRTVIHLINLPQLIQMDNNTIMVVLEATEIGLSCYIAGRLAKVKENLILMILVTICVAAEHISGIMVGNATIGVFTPLIIWLDICVAYFLRYKEHREAGLADASKK